MKLVYVGFAIMAACIVQPAPPPTGPAGPQGAPGDSSYGDSSYGDSRYGGSSYGGSAYGGSRYGGSVYGGSSYGGSSYGGTAIANPGGSIPAQQILGHWSGDWGDLYLSIDADGTTRGVYPHDTGTIVGRIENDVFRGWWCEAPSRQPPRDAGDVELRFGRDANGLLVDGRWRYGASGNWNENWDLRWVESTVDAALMSRLDDHSQFCPHP